MLANDVKERSDTRAMIWVPGIPRAKPRQTRRDAWDPSKAIQLYRYWADLIKLGWSQAIKDDPWEGAIAFGAVFQFPIPKSWPVAKRREGMHKELPHTIKPDIDNLLKGASDPLNGLAYRDDAQITQLIEPTAKIWAPEQNSGAWIIVEKLK